MLSPNKRKALQALLTHSTKKAAAAAAGITDRTLSTYLQDPAFQEEYKRAFDALVDDAARQSKQALSPALCTLRDIVEDSEESASSRISASRALLEFSLRIVEQNDILHRIEELERHNED